MKRKTFNKGVQWSPLMVSIVLSLYKLMWFHLEQQKNCFWQPLTTKGNVWESIATDEKFISSGNVPARYVAKERR